MKILLIIAATIIIAASLYADHKWRQWLVHHHPDRDQ